MRRIGTAATVLAVWLPVALWAAEPKPPAPKPPKPPPAAKPQGGAPPNPQAQARQARVQAANQQARAAQQALNAPNVVRLAQMSPEERAAALAKLPPDRREQLAQRLEKFSQLPEDQKARAIGQYQRLQALPPERQIQAREALVELQAVQPPRRGVVAMELNKLGSMTDDQRVAYMNSPGFRRRFSAPEIQMMDNLRGIVP